jgi:DNA gyrase subunit A
MKNKHEATLKAGDEIVQEFDTMNSAEVLAFTANGDCHKVKLSDIDDTKAGSFGTYLPAITGDSDILNYSVLDSKHKFVVHVFENKKIAKIDLQSFVSNHKRLKNSINTKSKLINTFTFEKDGAFKIYTDRFDLECDTSTFTMSKSRSAQGANATSRKGEVTKAEKV